MSALPNDLFPYLQYATPPVVGAFIGYLTNKLAIRMLFRPLRPWYLGKLKVPMTPGVIPSKRGELAENMGEVVGEHLLTSEEVGKGLQSEVFQTHLHSLISSRVDGLLNKDLGSITELIPAKYQIYLALGSQTISFKLKTQLNQYIQSPQFSDLLTDKLSGLVDTLLSSEVNNLLDASQRNELYSRLELLIGGALQGDNIAQWIDDIIHQQVYGALQQNKALGEILPEALQELVLQSLEQQVPAFLDGIANLATEPQIRNTIIDSTCEGVSKFIDSLGPMADMVRNFLPMEMVEAKVREYLESKNDSIRNWLQSDDIQNKVVLLVRERGADFFDRPLTELVGSDRQQEVDAFCKQCSSQLVRFLRDDKVISQFRTLIETSLEEHLDEGQASLQQTFTALLGKSRFENARQQVLRNIVDKVQGEQAQQLAGAMLDKLLQAMYTKKIGTLGRFIPSGIRDGLVQYFQGAASSMLAQEIPGIVQSLNIRSIVTDKINSLDLLRLERLLLSIMEEQFKYINLFGALLGFLIGCINILLIQAG